MEWQWANEHRLTWQLDKITANVVLDDLLDALAELLIDPYRTDLSSPMRGRMYGQDRFIAPLPHGYALVFTPYPDGIVPTTSEPTLLIRDFFNMAARFDPDL